MLDVHPGLALADRHEPLLRAEATHEEDPHAGEYHGRENPGEEGGEPGVFHVPGELDVRLLELGHQPRILDARRDEVVRFTTRSLQLLELLFREQRLDPVGRERAADGFSVQGEIADLALLRERLELAVRHVRGPGPEERELKCENREEGDSEIPDCELPLFQFHDRGLYAACAGTASRAACTLSFTIRWRTHPLASCPPVSSARSNKLSRPLLGGVGYSAIAAFRPNRAAAAGSGASIA